jgi:hydroxypyruvate reductase
MQLRRDAEAIFRAGVDRVDPRPMVRDTLQLDGDRLTVSADGCVRSWDLAGFDRILVLGFGKAAARMALGAEDVLGGRIREGLVAVRAGTAGHCARVRILEAAHPVPDGSSVAAAQAIMDLARRADERTLALVLVSGGGSALLCAPWGDDTRALSLADKAAVTRELLASGADIHEINTVRRHLSAVKGGRLAEALAPATVVGLLLSDVVGDDIAAIASGPTVPDPTRWADVRAIVHRHDLAPRIPAPVLRLIEDGVQGRIPDTPKPGSRIFDAVTNLVIGSNRLAAGAARDRARELGYATLYLGSRMTGEARELARMYLGLGLECAERGQPLPPPACIVAGGETTVTLRGRGRGGRNQEMALAFLAGLAESDPAPASRLCFLSAGTDGIDGPTDAAGAFADLDLIPGAQRAGMVPGAYLAENDSYRFFDVAGGLLRTGPTNTNVCDLQILLVR